MTRRRRTLAISGLLALVLVAVVAVFWIQSATRPVQDGYTGHAASPSATPTTAPAQSPAGSPAAEAAPSEDGTGAATASPSVGGAEAADRPSWIPATEVPDGAEAEAKVPNGEGSEPHRLPEAPERRPALTSMPDSNHAEFALVADFPDEVVPVPDGAEVQSSSVEPQGERVLVGVSALTRSTPAEVMAFYSTHCADRAWVVSGAPATGTADQLDCGFGQDRLTVTVSELQTGRLSVTANGSFLVDAG